MRIHLVGGDGRAEVEGDLGDISDHITGLKIRPRGDHIVEIALAASGAVLRRQEADRDIGRQAGRGVLAGEQGRQHPGLQVQLHGDAHQDVDARIGHGHDVVELLRVRRDGDDRVAEAHLGEREGTPRELGIERVADGHDLSGRRGSRFVLEVDSVRQGAIKPNRAGGAEPGWTDLLVRVLRLGNPAAVPITGDPIPKLVPPTHRQANGPPRHRSPRTASHRTNCRAM